MSVHTPQRLNGESQADYKARRKASNAIGRELTTIGNGGVSSREKFRDSMRASGTMSKRIRAYVALMAAWAGKRITKAAHRDEHGAFTYVGREKFSPDENPQHARRMWLAGVSAQRGY
mgnify:CR=1 FL=1